MRHARTLSYQATPERPGCRDIADQCIISIQKDGSSQIVLLGGSSGDSSEPSVRASGLLPLLAADLKNSRNLLNDAIAVPRPDRARPVVRNNTEASGSWLQPPTSAPFAWLALMGRTSIAWCLSCRSNRRAMRYAHIAINSRQIAYSMSGSAAKCRFERLPRASRSQRCWPFRAALLQCAREPKRTAPMPFSLGFVAQSGLPFGATDTPAAEDLGNLLA
jgi:hypothetical protein